MLNTFKPFVQVEKKSSSSISQPFSGDRPKIWSFPSFGTSNGGSGTVTTNVAFFFGESYKKLFPWQSDTEVQNFWLNDSSQPEIHATTSFWGVDALSH